jgi:hypothetical protein
VCAESVSAAVLEASVLIDSEEGFMLLEPGTCKKLVQRGDDMESRSLISGEARGEENVFSLQVLWLVIQNPEDVMQKF